MHGGTATFVQVVPVREEFEGAPVWEGVVHVFDLVGNPAATRAFAWSSPMEAPPNGESMRSCASRRLRRRLRR